MRKNFVFIVISLLLAVCVLWPLRHAGDWYPMHDSSHPARVILMEFAWAQGSRPPLWSNIVNGGYGYPLFQFYAPLFHSGAAILAHLFRYVTTSLKLMVFLSVALGSLGAMVFARRWGRLAAVTAGVLFAFAPYAAVDIYVRGAFAEFLSIALLPWVFVTTEKIKTIKQLVSAACVMALFVMSHNLIPIVALPMIAVWGVVRNRGQLKYFGGAVVLSILFAFWYVGPIIFERNFTSADEIARTTYYARHFVEPWQMWNSTWGFGGSAPGVEDGMSFKLGKIQIILGVLGMIAAFLRRKKYLILTGVFLTVSLFLATPYAKFIWDKLSLLQIVQFPWRTLGIATFFLSILGAYAVSTIPGKPFRFVGTVAVITVACVMGLKYFRPQTLIVSPMDAEIITEDDIPDVAPIVPEFAPRWWHPELLPHEEDYSGRFEFSAVPNQLEPTGDESEIQGQREQDFRYDLLARQDVTASFGLAYYPTWIATLDGNNVPVTFNESGLVTVKIPEGRHEIILRQGHTGFEKAANLISLFAVVSAVIMLGLPRLKKERS